MVAPAYIKFGNHAEAARYVTDAPHLSALGWLVTPCSAETAGLVSVYPAVTHSSAMLTRPVFGRVGLVADLADQCAEAAQLSELAA
jgi:hypothetical protein